MVPLYQLNMVHRLLHLVDWKFHCCLNFLCLEQKTFEKMKNFVDSLYDYDYSGANDEESNDEEEAAIVIETDKSKAVSHTAADQLKLVTLTVVVKKETSTLTLILMNQLTLPLINFLFLKQNFKGLNKAF